MYLASKMVTQLLGSVEQEHDELFPDLKKERIRCIVRAAGLLHDVGHGPFSHASESAMTNALIDLHVEEVESAKKVLVEPNEEKLPVHEYFSYKLMTESGELKDILDEELGSKNVAALITKEIGGDAEVAKNKNGLSILRKIISSQLDADRMDYIIRDAVWAGVSYGSIDPDRVIGNMAIRRNNERYELAIHEKALNAIESIIDARFKMYKWVYHHHMVVATEELAQRLVLWLCQSDPEVKKRLYWKAFQEGDMSDIDMELALKHKLRVGCEHARPFAGFIDRRYLPVSLIKRRDDLERLYDDIIKAMKRNVDYPYVDKMFEEMFKNRVKYAGELERALSGLGSPVDKTVLLPVNKQASPYKALGGEKIWLYSDTGGRGVTELTKASSYVRHINAEFTEFPSIYFSYLVPGTTKTEARAHAEKVREAVVRVMAKIDV
jgi:hypothetical protein